MRVMQHHAFNPLALKPDALNLQVRERSQTRSLKSLAFEKHDFKSLAFKPEALNHTGSGALYPVASQK